MMDHSALMETVRIKKIAEKVRKLSGALYRIGVFRPFRNENRLAENVGPNVREWKYRAELAMRILADVKLGPGQRVADYGCGRQTLRTLLPPDWTYTPFDYCERSNDTRIVDFNTTFPSGDFDVIFILGVLEYLNRPTELLAHALRHARFLVFSYNFLGEHERRERQGWISCVDVKEIDNTIVSCGEIVGRSHIGKNQWVYLCRGDLSQPGRTA